ncbi:MAG: hypothetical protein ABII82_03510, partial [Verrucomicrobiota bacterium]
MTSVEKNLRAALLAALCLCAPAAGAAEVSVSGLGWWDNREMRRSLERLHEESREGALDAVGIEDMAFVLIADLESRGHLKPR